MKYGLSKQTKLFSAAAVSDSTLFVLNFEFILVSKLLVIKRAKFLLKLVCIHDFKKETGTK